MSAIVNRNNVLAGAFVIGSLVLAVGIAVVLGDVLGSLGSKNEFAVRFPTSVGVTGLQPGSEVTFAGMPVGRVTQVRPYLPHGPGRPAEAMEVLIAIDTRVTLHEDALADLAPPILGGVSRINFASPGHGPVPADAPNAALASNNANGLLEPGEAVRGRFAPSILAQLGFTVEDAERLRNTIADVEAVAATARRTLGRVDRMAEDFQPRFDAATEDARAVLADARSVSSRLAPGGDWAGRVDSILANADRTAAAAPAVADEFRQAVAAGRAIFETRAANIDRILANVERVTERVRFETMDQAEELLREGTLALASFRSVGEQTGSMLGHLRPDVTAAAANTRSITQQARLFLDEIRAQPWRLLKQPSREDLLREPIYAAARTYADAVADLRAASEALESALLPSGPDARPDAPMEIARIAGTVQAAYDRYAQAERALLETLRARTDE